jgi:Flp pilus assembly protein TadD
VNAKAAARERAAVAALALCAAAGAALAHGFLLRAPFIYDDAGFVFGNPLVTGPWPGLGAFFGRTFARGEYEPLVTLAHWVLFRAFGASPWPYRLTSLGLHWANVALVWRLARRRLGDDRLALAVAALFGVFPAHVEVLALTSFKKHLGAAFFGLLLLELQDRAGVRPRARAALGALLLGASALCKESGLIFLPLAAAAAWTRGPRGLREDRGVLAALAAAACAYAAARAGFVPRIAAPLVGGGWTAHVLTSAKILLWHLGQLVLPADLSIEHDLAPVRGLGLEGLLCALGALGWLAAGAALARRDRVAAFAWTWTTLALAPFLNLIPFLNFSLVANRYEYLASAGFLLLAARLAAPLLRADASGGARRVLLAAALPFALYSAESARFAFLFDSPLALWTDAARRAPGNGRAHAGLGDASLARGLDAQAVSELKRAIELAPDYVVSYQQLSLAEYRLGRLDEAIAASRARLGLHDDAEAEQNLGLLLLEAGRDADALVPLRAAAAQAPDAAEPKLGLARALLGLARLDEARVLFQEAALAPGTAPEALTGLGDVAAARHDERAAAAFYADALSRNPNLIATSAKLVRADRALGRDAEAARARADALSRLAPMLEALRGRAEGGSDPALAKAEALERELAGPRRQ